MKALGIILIAAGIFMIFFRNISFTQQKKVVDLGSVEISKKERKSVTWPVYTGGVAVFAGVLVLLGAANKKS